MNRVLLVEPDPVTARSITLMLNHAYFDVQHVDLGEQAVKAICTNNYHIVLVEMHLPDMSGLDVLTQVRDQRVNTLIMALTSDDSIESKIKFYSFGGDHHLAKPFHREELISVMQARLRREQGMNTNMFNLGSLSIDLKTRIVKVNGQHIPVTRREYDMIELLCLRDGVPLTKDQFLNHLYGNIEERPAPKIIDVMVCKIRKKLCEADPNRTNFIETVWGQGYKFYSAESIDALYPKD